MAELLFDERDLRVFDNPDSREYFREILQSYYSQNYRATIVLLYSFVVYDLYNKLQIMAREGDKNAKSSLSCINNLIGNDEKYSKVEKEVINFYLKNCPLYFERFEDDIEYLQKLRNKSAHLKVNDDSLFIPKDYQVRMLICSMYEHVLSVKAPFIMNLFNLVENEIKKYTSLIFAISNDGLEDEIKKEITKKYLCRMTYDSLKKSYITFVNFLFVSKDEDCINNIFGLYAFVFSITDYALSNGYQQLFKEQSVISVFSRIDIDELKTNSARVSALHALVLSSPILLDILKNEEELYEYVRQSILTLYNGLKYYSYFYPRETNSVFTFFKNNQFVQKPEYTDCIYKEIKDSKDFDIKDFLLVMINAVPIYSGFYAADRFMSFFKEHLNDLTKEDIENILNQYYKNDQCTRRSRHDKDMREVQDYINNIDNISTQISDNSNT